MKTDQKIYRIHFNISDDIFLTRKKGEYYFVIGYIRYPEDMFAQLQRPLIFWETTLAQANVEIKEATEEDIELAVMNEL